MSKLRVISFLLITLVSVRLFGTDGPCDFRKVITESFHVLTLDDNHDEVLNDSYLSHIKVKYRGIFLPAIQFRAQHFMTVRLETVSLDNYQHEFVQDNFRPPVS